MNFTNLTTEELIQLHLTTKEILQLQKDVNNAVRKIEPQEPNFYIRPSVKMETKEYVNNELVPVFEFNITVSKEDLHTYRILWEQYYQEMKELYRYHHHLTPSDKVTLEIRKDLENAFSDLMNKNFKIQ